MSIIETLTSLFAPSDCLGCGQEGSLLCRSCFRALPAVPGRCFSCYVPLSMGVACPPCLQLTGFGTVRAASSYDGLARDLLRQLKFRGNQSAARLMVQAMLLGPELPSSALLVHVPATTRHVRRRGYDQAELLARLLSRRTGLPYLPALARYGQQHQLGAGRQQRQVQLGQSLRAKSSKAIRGQHIILIDDVLTTGASLHAAAAVLQAAGASQVDALVFAQA